MRLSRDSKPVVVRECIVCRVAREHTVSSLFRFFFHFHIFFRVPLCSLSCVERDSGVHAGIYRFRIEMASFTCTFLVSP